MSIEAAEKRVRQADGVAAYWSRRDNYDQDKIDAARRDARDGLAEVAIRKALESAPPVTDEQRERLAALLAGGAK